MDNKERFIQIFTQNIKREGADRLLDYLKSDASDFFKAPASTRYHLSCEGGLLQHSLNVYDCLMDYLSRPSTKEKYKMEYSDETVAIVALLHDLCKVNVYKTGFRNVKDENGVWNRVPVYEFDDKMPYGHGEKSVYILSGYMRLSREEAFAIRYHMGFSGSSDEKSSVSYAFQNFPLTLALSVADMEATYFLES